MQEEPRSLYGYIAEAMRARRIASEHRETYHQALKAGDEAESQLREALARCGLKPGDLVSHGGETYTLDEAGFLDLQPLKVCSSVLTTPPPAPQPLDAEITEAALQAAVEDEPYRSDLDLIRAARHFDAPPPPTTCADPLCHRDPRIKANDAPA